MPVWLLTTQASVRTMAISGEREPAPVRTRRTRPKLAVLVPRPSRADSCTALEPVGINTVILPGRGGPRSPPPVAAREWPARWRRPEGVHQQRVAAQPGLNSRGPHLRRAANGQRQQAQQMRPGASGRGHGSAFPARDTLRTPLNWMTGVASGPRPGARQFRHATMPGPKGMPAKVRSAWIDPDTAPPRCRATCDWGAPAASRAVSTVVICRIASWAAIDCPAMSRRRHSITSGASQATDRLIPSSWSVSTGPLMIKRPESPRPRTSMQRANAVPARGRRTVANSGGTPRNDGSSRAASHGRGRARRSRLGSHAARSPMMAMGDGKGRRVPDRGRLYRTEPRAPCGVAWHPRRARTTIRACARCPC